MSQQLSGPELAPSSGVVKKLVILLHGYGSDGQDLIGLAPMMRGALPDTHFISPNGCEPGEMGFGYQWFPLGDRALPAMLAGANRALPILDHFITEQRDRFGLTDADIALLGFSQGTMMALHIAPRRKDAIAGVVGFSGALLGGMQDITARPPVCLIHGTSDDVVPFEAMAMAKLALEEAGIAVETHACGGLPHGIDPAGMEIAVTFLKKHLFS